MSSQAQANEGLAITSPFHDIQRALKEAAKSNLDCLSHNELEKLESLSVNLIDAIETARMKLDLAHELEKKKPAIKCDPIGSQIIKTILCFQWRL